MENKSGVQVEGQKKRGEKRKKREKGKVKGKKNKQ